MAVFWIVYILFSVVIVWLVIKCLSLSDELENERNMCDLNYKMFVEMRDKYEKDEEIINMIKEILPF